MTHRTEHPPQLSRLSPFVTLPSPTTCATCGERLEAEASVVPVVRANPSRRGYACASCWRSARVCAGCSVEITPEVEHYMRWLPKRNQFVAWCLVCSADRGLAELQALS